MNRESNRREPKRKLMTYVLIGLGVLVVLAATPFVVGRFLPERYEAEVRATFARPPQDVWAELMNRERHPVAGRMCKEQGDLPSQDGMPCWTEDLGSSETTVRTTALEEGRYTRREMSDDVVPVTAVMEYRLEAVDGGTRLVATNVTSIPDGTWHVPFFRFMMTVMNGAERTLKDQAKSLGRALGAPPDFG